MDLSGATRRWHRPCDKSLEEKPRGVRECEPKTVRKGEFAREEFLLRRSAFGRVMEVETDFSDGGDARRVVRDKSF